MNYKIKVENEAESEEGGMKEYLEEKEGGGLKLVMRGNAYKGNGIEVPDGAESYYFFDAVDLESDSDDFAFYKNGLDFVFQDNNCWDENRGSIEFIKNKGLILWQRKETLNDQVASAETARQAEKVLKEILEGNLPDFDFELNVEKSGVEKTLSERQSQYGCFEDVAHITQGMIGLMRQCGYDDMPKPHQMALSMIASKMARIVNGDCNHLDSWHDIGGYSKLIENLIEGK